MISPCPRCGEVKTESVRHGILYHLLWKLGYHLRRCSRCNRPRALRRPKSRAHFEEESILNTGTDSFLESDLGPSGFERNMRSGAAYPRNEPAETGSSRNEDQGATQVAAAWEESSSEYGCCPRCGSTQYRRSRRSAFEKMIGRPRMARCRRCFHRFPYPE